MSRTRKGVGKFTPQNLVAVLRAVPESHGAYRDIAEWIRNGNADTRADGNSTAYAGFAKRYQELIHEHRSRDDNRNRELNRAFEILERTCERGNKKMLLKEETVAEQCPAIPRDREPRVSAPTARTGHQTS